MHTIEEFRGKYAFLSSFYRHTIVGAGGIPYRWNEAGYHAGKTRNLLERCLIAAAPTPSEAKRRGRLVTLRSDWNETHRHVVMRAVLRAKFADPNLSRQLLATGDAHLVEGNRWHDQFWGDCRCGRAVCARPGKNFLGRYLMQLRTELANQ
ncbi:NADAR family protein [Amycolatopsis sp. lyj-108]|uniref:NADAR family protein n=1 Tax=Amycolatopsis sp. lyj-108 TaxID=2789286 RepID=UPI003978870D